VKAPSRELLDHSREGPPHRSSLIKPTPWIKWQVPVVPSGELRVAEWMHSELLPFSPRQCGHRPIVASLGDG